MSLPADDAASWLRLVALPLSARRKHGLLRHFGHAAALFEADESALRAAGAEGDVLSQLAAARKLDVARDVARLADLSIDLVPRGDPRYPPLLATLEDAPAVLFVRGRLPEANRPCVAIVGTRRASAYGELVAETLGRELAGVGVGVISGLAAGIDSSAHHGALRAGGYTAGVLGTGVDQVYPKSNAALAERVAAEGALISEFPLGAGPRSWHFPARNRIISGLSRAVVVVQAPTDSGALITARLAGEQGREVLAVPGNVTDTRCAGCHQLIRDGATLARGADDVLAALGLERLSASELASEQALPLREKPPAAPAPLPALSPPEAKVAGALGLVPQSIDDVIDTTALATPEVQSALVTLELKGVARRLPGNRFVRAT
jgi:DNA processing protein